MTARLRLVDAPGEAGRTTATLLASLAARLGALYLVSGADAVGSLAAGFAALGRRVGATAEGARLRAALEQGRVGANGDILWTTLGIETWVSSLPPSPVLDQLRNDIALVIVDDPEETLALMPIPGEPAGERAEVSAHAEFVDPRRGIAAAHETRGRAHERFFVRAAKNGWHGLRRTLWCAHDSHRLSRCEDEFHARWLRRLERRGEVQTRPPSGLRDRRAALTRV